MSEDLFWRARTFADKTLKDEVQKEIIKLAYVMLGNHQLKIEENKEGFDRYPYCKHDTKKWCPVGSKTMRYRGRWCEYVVYGHTKTDIYLEVLKLLANDNSVYYPVVSYRRENEWIEREEYEALQEENKLMKQYVKNGLENGYIDDNEKDYEAFLGKNE